MAEYFSLTHELNIYLYGENKKSISLVKTLTHQGFVVKGIIDRKYTKKFESSIDCFHLPLNELEKEKNKNGAVVIICLNNGLAHYSVAKLCFQLGFDKVVFLPLGCNNIPINIRNKMISAYSELIESGFESTKTYPFVNIFFDKNIESCKYEIIEINDNYVSFLFPVVRLFTLRQKDLISNIVIPSRLDGIQKYCDMPICNFEPYRVLFSYLDGDQNADIEQYLNLFREDEREREALLNDRKELMVVYRHNLKYNFSFFLNSPANCIVDEDKIRVVDGYHRIFFLIHSGYSFVPVRLKKSDFDIIIQKE